MPHDYYYPLILILGALVAAYFLLRRRSCKKPTAVVDPKPIPVPTVVPGKFYLGIALSHVDSRRYNGWEGKLGGTIPDVKLFEKNLSLRGFKTQLVLDGAATRSNVSRVLNQYAENAKAGDLVCIAYSGHGNNVLDTTGEENDGQDETWVLWDGEFIDDELWLILKKFKPGVRVLMFSDSCHSGTMYRNARRDTTLKVIEMADSENLDCHLKYFGGCLDAQFSMDMGNNGLFTRTLWGSVYKNRKMTYDMLFKRLYDRMPPDQKPTYHNMGTIIEKFNTDDIF